MIDLPPGVVDMAARGPLWADWVEALPRTVQLLMSQWQLLADGTSTHGHCSLVVPVRTAEGMAAVLKVGFPEQDSEHEHLVLRRWGGAGSVRLLSADPYRRGLLLERLGRDDLAGIPDDDACRIVAGLYGSIHVPPLPQLRSLSGCLEVWNAELAGLSRNAPIPRRLVEQAIAMGADLAVDQSEPDRVLHTDLHYANVLCGNRERWLVIDPKPLNGDPHYEIAPMLWNRWDEIAGNVRSGVRRRLWILAEAAGFDEDRARAWVLVRMVHNAMWELDENRPDRTWLTKCIAVAKAVQD